MVAGWQEPGPRARRFSFGSGIDSEFSRDRKSTRLNSSHSQISYAVFCLKTITARGKTTKLHVTATVTDAAPSADSFTIGGGTGGSGDVFFALHVGLRIDVHVRPR